MLTTELYLQNIQDSQNVPQTAPSTNVETVTTVNQRDYQNNMPPPNYAQAVNTISGPNLHYQQATTNFNQGHHNMPHWNSAQQFSTGIGTYPSPNVVTYANLPVYPGYSRMNQKFMVIFFVV